MIRFTTIATAALALALARTDRPHERPPAPMARAASDSLLTPFARAKAEALLRDRLPCLGCHRLGDEGGAIGPALTDVAARRSPTYIAAMVADPQRTVPGTIMPRTPMPEAMRELIVRYLSERRGGSGAGGPPPTSESTPPSPPDRHQTVAPPTIPTRPTSGAELYARFCVACHGATGRGDGPNARHLPVPPANHASAEAMSSRSDDRLFDGIAGGGYVLDRSPRMPPFGETLSRDEIRLLVRHIRTLCRCEGPDWSARSNAVPPR